MKIIDLNDGTALKLATALRNYPSGLVSVAIDTSGSSDIEKIIAGIAAIGDALRIGGDAHVNIVQFDHTLAFTGACRSGNFVETLHKIGIRGGGGTSLQPVFDVLEDPPGILAGYGHGLKPRGKTPLILLTDGEFHEKIDDSRWENVIMVKWAVRY